MFERIVVGLDGSEISEAALATGTDLARRLNVPLHLVRAADLTRMRLGANEAAEAYAELSSEMQGEKAVAERYLEDVASPLQQEGLTVTTEVRSGEAAGELLDVVTPRDLLVVSSHGRGGLKRMLLGSVAEEVARKSPAPVLIARKA